MADNLPFPVGTEVNFATLQTVHPQHHGINSFGGVARSIICDVREGATYPDHWISEGTILDYTGQGHLEDGDQQWNSYNLSLRRAMDESTAVHVFEKIQDSPTRYRYHGKLRVIQFRVVRLGGNGPRIFRFVLSSLPFPDDSLPVIPMQGAEGLASDVEEPPARFASLTFRVIRDTALSKRLKRKYDFACQLCGYKQRIGESQFYAEAHHIRPLGRPHDGPDSISNLIVLCSNHHVAFDLGVVAINPEDGLTIKHPFDDSLDGAKVTLVHGHLLGKEHLEYHWEHIFRFDS